MMKHLFTITIISTIALLGPERASAQEAGIMLASAAPGASVVTLDGKQVDLSTYIGKKPVVLEFWATWCPLCKQLESQMQEAREVFGDKVTFVSVGVRDNQSPEKQRMYAEMRHLGGEFVFDKDGKAVAAYKCWWWAVAPWAWPWGCCWNASAFPSWSSSAAPASPTIPRPVAATSVRWSCSANGASRSA